ncbi:MAG: twin-arginine translocation signal domain-containing protein, partial [Candidatus Hydrogenedentales bacterium]
MESSSLSSNRPPTRRDFLKTTGAVAASLTLAQSAASQAPVEKLALNGGPKAVTSPDSDASHWPRFGETEEKAVLELVRNPGYAPLDELEK